MAETLVQRLRDIEPTFAGYDVGETIAEAANRIEYLESRLEVAPEWGENADGIACRNDTIRLQDERIERLTAEVEHYRIALQAIDKWCCPVLCQNCAGNRETAREALTAVHAERQALAGKEGSEAQR